MWKTVVCLIMSVNHGPSTTFFPKLNAQRLQFSLWKKVPSFVGQELQKRKTNPWDKATWINKFFLSFGFLGIEYFSVPLISLAHPPNHHWLVESVFLLFVDSFMFGTSQVNPRLGMPFLVLDFMVMDRDSTNIWEMNPNRLGLDCWWFRNPASTSRDTKFLPCN